MSLDDNIRCEEDDNMPRVNVTFDIDPEYLMEESEKKNNRKDKKKHEKDIKIEDDLFEIALRKGLIEKTEDGYVFVGDYEVLIAIKNTKVNKNLNDEWLD